MDTKELEKWKAKEIEKLDKKYYRLMWFSLIFNTLYAGIQILMKFPDNRLGLWLKRPEFGFIPIVLFVLLIVFAGNVQGADKRLRKVIEKNELYQMYLFKSIRCGFCAMGGALVLWVCLIDTELISIPPAVVIWAILWLGIITVNITNLVYRSRK